MPGDGHSALLGRVLVLAMARALDPVPTVYQDCLFNIPRFHSTMLARIVQVSVPSAVMSAFAPGLAEVGFSARTTVARANATPARLSSAACSSRSISIVQLSSDQPSAVSRQLIADS